MTVEEPRCFPVRDGRMLTGDEIFAFMEEEAERMARERTGGGCD